MATITVERPRSFRATIIDPLVDFVDKSVFAGRYHFEQYLANFEKEKRDVMFTASLKDPDISLKYNSLTDNFLTEKEPEIKRQFLHNFTVASVGRLAFTGEMLREVALGQVSEPQLLFILVLAGASERIGLLLTRRRLQRISNTVHNFSKLALESPDSVRFSRDTFANFPQLH